MTTTQLGSVVVDPKQDTTPRSRHSQKSGQGDTGPHMVLDVILRLMKRGRADQLATEMTDLTGRRVSKQVIQSWRSGRVRMTVPTCQQLAQCLDVPAELFLGHHDNAARWIIDHQHPDYPCNRASGAAC